MSAMASFRASTRAAAASRMSPFGNSQNSHCFFNAIPAHLPCREPGLGMCDSPPTASRCFGRTKSLIGYVALFTATDLALAHVRVRLRACVTVCLSLCVANFRKTKKIVVLLFFRRVRPLSVRVLCFPRVAVGQLIDCCSLALLCL